MFCANAVETQDVGCEFAEKSQDVVQRVISSYNFG
jgi:hypothetical protein